MTQDLRKKFGEIGVSTPNKRVAELTKISLDVSEEHVDTIAEPMLHLVKILDHYNRADPRDLLREVNDFCETITPIMCKLIVGGSIPQGHWNMVNAIFQKLRRRDDQAAGSARLAASTLQALYNIRSFKGAHKPKVLPKEFDVKFCALGSIYAFHEYLGFLLYAGHISRDDLKINSLLILLEKIADHLIQVPVKPPSLAGLIRKCGVQSHSDKFLVLIWHVSKYEGVETVNIRDIERVYRKKMKQTMPNNPNAFLNNLAAKGLLVEAGVKNGLQAFSITPDGEEKVEHLLKRSS